MENKIRWLLQKDVKSILEIQNSCPYSPNWSKKYYIDIVKSKKNSEAKNMLVSYVCEVENNLVGYVVYKVGLASAKNEEFFAENTSIISKSPVFYGKITNLCVHPDYRMQGIGRSLIEFVIKKFSDVKDLTTEVPSVRPFILFTSLSDRDLGSHLFYSKMGFLGKNVSRDLFGKDHDGYSFYLSRM